MQPVDLLIVHIVVVRMDLQLDGSIVRLRGGLPSADDRRLFLCELSVIPHAHVVIFERDAACLMAQGHLERLLDALVVGGGIGYSACISLGLAFVGGGVHPDRPVDDQPLLVDCLKLFAPTELSKEEVRPVRVRSCLGGNGL